MLDMTNYNNKSNGRDNYIHYFQIPLKLLIMDAFTPNLYFALHEEKHYP